MKMFLFGSILRSGRDTKVAFIIDASSIWLVGIPLAAIATFVFNQPVYIVMILVMLDELFKFILAFIRLKSGRWLHDLT